MTCSQHHQISLGQRVPGRVEQPPAGLVFSADALQARHLHAVALLDAGLPEQGRHQLARPDPAGSCMPQGSRDWRWRAGRSERWRKGFKLCWRGRQTPVLARFKPDGRQPAAAFIKPPLQHAAGLPVRALLQ